MRWNASRARDIRHLANRIFDPSTLTLTALSSRNGGDLKSAAMRYVTYGTELHIAWQRKFGKRHTGERRGHAYPRGCRAERPRNCKALERMRARAGQDFGDRRFARARRSLPRRRALRQGSRYPGVHDGWDLRQLRHELWIRENTSGSAPASVSKFTDSQFTCFSVPHDSADPLGFVIEKDGIKIGIVLDLGYLSNLVLERLKGCDGIVLESNHDVQMLKVGPYPWALKQRVMSRRGHLSNDSVAQYLAE